MPVAVLPQLVAQTTILTALQPFFFAGGPPIILGVLYLAILRGWGFKNRLFDYNVDLDYGSCTGRELKYRTLEGHCNNLNQTAMGMANKRFGRSALNDPDKAGPGLMEPDPYIVAELLLKRKDGVPRQVATPYNMFLNSWINLNLHDWEIHDQNPDEQHTLRWGPLKSDTFKLNKTKLDPEGFTLNAVTPWWDASQIYGITPEIASSLRVPGKCELALDGDGNLPIGPDGMPLVGLHASWFVGVEILHHLFVLEHNYVCATLRKAHKKTPEDELYDISRMVIAAELAKIHTTEWTPALLNNEVMDVAMHNNWVGLPKAFLANELPKVNKTLSPLKDKLHIAVHQAILKAATLIAPETKGVGHKTYLAGTPYSLSEDFVSAYRLHPLMPDEFLVAGKKVTAGEMIFSRARTVVKEFGLEKLADSWGHIPPTTLTLHNYPDFLTKVAVPGEDGPRNMAVVDILRDRERGMVRYNQARRQYGMKPAEKFEDITDNAEWALELKSVYKDVEDVDFLVGCLAESPRPAGFAISNVQFFIFLLNASRRLLCDRFFQEAYNEHSYTKEGLAIVEATTFKSLLIRHYPGLKDSIGDVKNAFFAWTGDQKYGAPAPVHEEL